MTRVKYFGVLRHQNLKGNLVANQVFSTRSTGLLVTFGADEYTNTREILDEIQRPTVLDNGAFLSKHKGTVLEGKNKGPIYYAQCIKQPFVDYFIEPDVVSPANISGALRYCVEKSNQLYRFIPETSRKKAIRPIQGIFTTDHLYWFRNYLPNLNLHVDYVAFGGLMSYPNEGYLKSTIMKTTRILVAEHGIRRVHLLGVSTPWMMNFIENLLDFVDGVSFDSATPAFLSFMAGRIVIPPTSSENLVPVNYRRRSFDPFSQITQSALDNCWCPACRYLQTTKGVGIAAYLESIIDVPIEIQNLIILHNTSMYGRWVELRFPI